MMKTINKVLLAMNVIEEEMALACEYEFDARYIWPKRWNRLRQEVKKLSKSALTPENEKTGDN